MSQFVLGAVTMATCPQCKRDDQTIKVTSIVRARTTHGKRERFIGNSPFLGVPMYGHGEPITVQSELASQLLPSPHRPLTKKAVNARIELLAQQARSLVQEHHLTVTSTECREIASGFEEAGFIDVADEIWLLARGKAQEEGDAQELYASRGYSWFLFRNQREENPCQILQEALLQLPNEKDSDRLVRARTLRIWLGREIDINRATSSAVTTPGRQIDELINACVTARARARDASRPPGGQHALASPGGAQGLAGAACTRQIRDYQDPLADFQAWYGPVNVTLIHTRE